MPRIPIVISFDKKYLIPALATVKSIINACSNVDRIEFFVLYKKLDPHLIRLTEDIIAYFGSVVTFIDCSSYLENLTFSNNENRAVETYFPLLIPSLFKDFGKVVCIDVDMLVRDDILKIVDALPNNKKIGGVRCMIRNHRIYHDFGDFNSFSKNILGLSNPYFYINSGIEVFNMDLITEDDAKYCISCIKNGWLFYDESILNHVFKDSVYHFPVRWNIYAEYLETSPGEFDYSMQKEIQEAQKNAAICHFVADTKPWDHPEGKEKNKYRIEYHQIVKEVKQTIQSILPKIICGYMWNRIDNA